MAESRECWSRGALAFWRSGGEDFHVDPVALSAYRSIVEALRAHGVKLIFVVPPTAGELLEPKRASFDRYVRQIRTGLVRETDLWFDYTDDAGFRLPSTDFLDGVHCTAEAAARLVADLDRRVEAAIAAVRLNLGRQRTLTGRLVPRGRRARMIA
jgi:hypothetical protein